MSVYPVSYFFPFESLTVGDNWKWTISIQNYPASLGWHLVYTTKNSTAPSVSFTSTAIGDKHQISVLPAVTDEFLDGIYYCSVVLISPDSERTTLGTKQITIKPDLSKVADDYDPRTYNQKCVDALKSVLYDNADSIVLEEVFHDYTLKTRSNIELLRLLNYYEMQVQKENGEKTGRIIWNRV